MKKLLFATLLMLSFATANAQDELTTFILIRHAEKVDDGTNNPDLTKEGQARAERLNALLKATDVGAIYSSPFKRTLNTVTPLANEKGLDIKEYNPRNLKDFATSMFADEKGKVVVVSGHSNTTPDVVNILLGDKRFEWLDEKEYTKIFIVTISEIGKGTVTMMSY